MKTKKKKKTKRKKKNKRGVKGQIKRRALGGKKLLRKKLSTATNYHVCVYGRGGGGGGAMLKGYVSFAPG